MNFLEVFLKQSSIKAKSMTAKMQFSNIYKYKMYKTMSV